MTTETMTVHKALCELKTLEGRIADKMTNEAFVFVNKHANTKIKGVPLESVMKSAKDTFQSLTDLIKRRDAIKRAVVLSNASTKVTIGGKEYTVAEAIEFKNNGIPIRQRLMQTLQSELKGAQNDVERSNKDIDDRADKYVHGMFGGAVDLKNMTKEIAEMRDKYIEAQTCEIIDCIDAEKVVRDLRDETDAFSVDVDSALSVSNAITTIEVEY